LNRWRQYNLREQAMLLLGAALVGAFLFWFALLKPVQSAVERQQLLNQASQSSLQRVRQLAAQLQQLQSSGSGESRGGDLIQLVDSSLRQNNLRMSGFQPGSDGSVSLRFDNVLYGGLLQWLYEMEINQGVVVEELSLRQGNAVGEVAATVRMRMAQ
jgi:general secretion pathway protein M